MGKMKNRNRKKLSTILKEEYKKGYEAGFEDGHDDYSDSEKQNRIEDQDYIDMREYEANHEK